MKSLFLSVISVAALAILPACAQQSANVPSVTKPVPAAELSKYSVATFAAGCFWHEEGLFESIKGVKEAISGYAGGDFKNPTYEDVETGNTGHAETVNVYYDPAQVSYADLLKVYFDGQDPTQVNGQGHDYGTEYRSIAFYRTYAEKQQLQAYIKQLNDSHRYNKPIAVQVMPLTKFWNAEEYHQNYIARNPDQGYVSGVCIPEIKAFQKEHPDMIKADHKY